MSRTNSDSSWVEPLNAETTIIERELESSLQAAKQHALERVDNSVRDAKERAETERHMQNAVRSIQMRQCEAAANEAETYTRGWSAQQRRRRRMIQEEPQ
jgi:hypothetical protein